MLKLNIILLVYLLNIYSMHFVARTSHKSFLVSIVRFRMGSEFDVGQDMVNGMLGVPNALVFFGEIEFYDGVAVPG